VWGRATRAPGFHLRFSQTRIQTRILRMRSRLLSPTFPFLAIGCLIVTASSATAQDVPSSDGRLNEVVLTKLSPPLYPQLARQARIAGDVRIQVQVRRDGSVASADAVSGHPRLKPAALASAQNSTFECRGCTEELAKYSLTYTLGFNNDSNCSLKRSRSAKCLYLWACGGLRRVYNEMPSPSVTQSQDHITILAGSYCFETQSNSLP